MPLVETWKQCELSYETLTGICVTYSWIPSWAAKKGKRFTFKDEDQTTFWTVTQVSFFEISTEDMQEQQHNYKFPSTEGKGL